MNRFLFVVALLFFNSTILNTAFSQPPISLFVDGTLSNLEGLPCNTNRLPTYGVLNFKNNGVNIAINQSKIIPNNTVVDVYCNESDHYYDSSLAQSYKIECHNGRWISTDNHSCVKKCEFDINEFTDIKDPNIARIVQQNGLIGNEDIELEISPFFEARGDGVSSSNGKIYANIGSEVTITCPEGYFPYTSNLSKLDLNDDLYSNNQFKTSCTGIAENKNKWTKYIACFNGTKPCKNADIKLKTPDGSNLPFGKQVTTYDGITYNEYDGVQKGDVKYTPHDGYYPIDCSGDQYMSFKDSNGSKRPKCNNGEWDSDRAYCKAKNTTVGNIFDQAEKMSRYNKVAKDDSLIENSPNDKVFWHEKIEFQCKYSNRVGGKDGKVFKIENISYGLPKIIKDTDIDNWSERFCVSDKKCKLYGNIVLSFYHDGDDSFNVALSFFKKDNILLDNFFEEGEIVYGLHSQYRDWWGGSNRWQRCDRKIYEFECVNREFEMDLDKGGDSFIGGDSPNDDEDQLQIQNGRVHKSRGHSYIASNSDFDHHGAIDYINCVGFNKDYSDPDFNDFDWPHYVSPHIVGRNFIPVQMDLLDHGEGRNVGTVGNKDKNSDGNGDGLYRYEQPTESNDIINIYPIKMNTIACYKNSECNVKIIDVTRAMDMLRFYPYTSGTSSRTDCYKHGFATEYEELDSCGVSDKVGTKTIELWMNEKKNDILINKEENVIRVILP